MGNKAGCPCRNSALVKNTEMSKAQLQSTLTALRLENTQLHDQSQADKKIVETFLKMMAFSRGKTTRRLQTENEKLLLKIRAIEMSIVFTQEEIYLQGVQIQQQRSSGQTSRAQELEAEKKVCGSSGSGGDVSVLKPKGILYKHGDRPRTRKRVSFWDQKGMDASPSSVDIPECRDSASTENPELSEEQLWAAIHVLREKNAELHEKNKFNKKLIHCYSRVYGLSKNKQKRELQIKHEVLCSQILSLQDKFLILVEEVEILEHDKTHLQTMFEFERDCQNENNNMTPQSQEVQNDLHQSNTILEDLRLLEEKYSKMKEENDSLKEQNHILKEEIQELKELLDVENEVKEFKNVLKQVIIFLNKCKIMRQCNINLELEVQELNHEVQELQTIQRDSMTPQTQHLQNDHHQANTVLEDLRLLEETYSKMEEENDSVKEQNHILKRKNVLRARRTKVSEQTRKALRESRPPPSTGGGLCGRCFQRCRSH